MVGAVLASIVPKLEFSRDPLSDTTPAWIDITAYLIEADWFSGKARDLDEPQAGGATFRLKNTNRRFEPEYAAGSYYPDIVPRRRFRWSITADGVSYPQGIYYAQSWQPQPLVGTTYTEVVVSCVDGFGVLALDPLLALDPPTAGSYGDVVSSDSPFAEYPLDEPNGRTLNPTTGPDGVYRVSGVSLGASNPVLGEASTAAFFSASLGGFARAKPDDIDVFKTAGQYTMECVATITNGNTFLMGFGYKVGSLLFVSELQSDQFIHNFASASTGVTPPSPGTYHFACTWDGSQGIHYINGVQNGAPFFFGGNMTASDAGEYLYIAGSGHGDNCFNDVTISHAAFYDYALPLDRIQAHAAAATARGYAADTAGNRVAALATNPLWSTAGIPAGQITVTPRMQTGQSTLDEILEAVKAETPISLFYFDDSGNPDYQPFEYPTTLQATFGESEVQVDDLGLQYDDEVFNQSTVSREGGLAKTASDATSQGQYGTRSHDETSLIISKDSDASLISHAVVDRFANPMYRIETLTLNGAAQSRRTQILTREIGDTIRVKRRGEGGTANPDVVTRILGKQKHLDVNMDLRCTWNLARGFPAQDAHWRLGQVGYGELGQTTVLA
jgi:hypothetical protein